MGGLSKCDWFDLRCSLRSVARSGRKVDKVWVAGDCPDWLSDEITKLPFKQPVSNPKNFKDKHRNLQETLRYISTQEEIPEEFIVGFSDVFLTKPVDFSSYPYYAKVTKNGLDLPASGGDDYSRSLRSTRAFLEEKELPIRYTTFHRFMRINKQSIKDSETLFDEVIERDIDVEPFCLVGNVMISKTEIVLTPVVDYKIWKGDEWWKSSPEVTDCFSIRTIGYGPLQLLLESKYKNKCKYEN